MDCIFQGIGSVNPCKKKPVKNSQYCAMHKFLMKNNNVKLCLCCNKRTYSKLQVCTKCNSNKIRNIQRYYNVVRPFRAECKRLRNIEK